MTVPVIADWTVNDSGGSAVTSITLTKPTGINVGDLLLIGAVNDAASNSEQWDDSTLKPTGFTLIKELGTASQDCHAAAFWRIADGTETDPITLPAFQANELIGWYLRVTGNHATPLHKTGADSTGNDTASLDITGVTTTIDDCRCFYVYAYDGGDAGALTTTGTGWSETDEQNSGTAAGDATGCFGTRALATQGASGTVTVTHSFDNEGQVGFQFAIAPSVAGGGAIIPVIMHHRKLLGIS